MKLGCNSLVDEYLLKLKYKNNLDIVIDYSCGFVVTALTVFFFHISVHKFMFPMFPWYRNQPKDLNYRSTDWYLCDRNIDLKWINRSFFHSARILTLVSLCCFQKKY